MSTASWRTRATREQSWSNQSVSLSLKRNALRSVIKNVCNINCVWCTPISQKSTPTVSRKLAFWRISLSIKTPATIFMLCQGQSFVLLRISETLVMTSCNDNYYHELNSIFNYVIQAHNQFLSLYSVEMYNIMGITLKAIYLIYFVFKIKKK